MDISNKNISFVMDNGMKINAFVIKDEGWHYIVRELRDKTIYGINKAKILTFKALDDDDINPHEQVSLIGCGNPEMPCAGVRMVKVGKVTQDDINMIVRPCPLYNESKCVKKNLGCITGVDKKLLEREFNEIVIGEYPTKKGL